MARQIIDLPMKLSDELSNDDLLLLRDLVAKKDKRLTLGDLANFVIGKIDLDKFLEVKNKEDVSAGSYYIKKNNNGEFEFVEKDEFVPGSFLVLTQNSAELSWGGQNKTVWSNGTWTQKGRLKKTTEPWILKITAPEDENWIVKLHHITGTVRNPSNSWSMSGIKDEDNSVYLTECLVANGDLYLHQETETFVEIPAGTTRRFDIYVRTQNGSSQWYGGGPTTEGVGAFGFGYSCMFDAVLVDKEKV